MTRKGKKRERNNKKWSEGRRKCGAATLGDREKKAKSRKRSDAEFRNDRTINTDVRNKMEINI